MTSLKQCFFKLHSSYSCLPLFHSIYDECLMILQCPPNILCLKKVLKWTWLQGNSLGDSLEFVKFRHIWKYLCEPFYLPCFTVIFWSLAEQCTNLHSPHFACGELREAGWLRVLQNFELNWMNTEWTWRTYTVRFKDVDPKGINLPSTIQHGLFKHALSLQERKYLYSYCG